jgi:hypothetical protein
MLEKHWHDAMGNPQKAADRPERTRESSELYNQPAATPR